MRLEKMFKKPHNPLEAGGWQAETLRHSEEEMAYTCPQCDALWKAGELEQRTHVCSCGHHFRISARQRIKYMADRGVIREMYSDLESRDLLSFPDYDKKLKNAQLASGEKEGVICGTVRIKGHRAALFAMEPYFMMGSMGSVVGEKITRLFEYATLKKLPVVGFTVSGGARMQEGIFSLMQMAKTSGAVRRHSQAGGLLVAVLTDPTTGGVTASFAMEGDIIMAEPGALIGFAGPRVIEQTIRATLPEGFQRSEFLEEHGFVDLVTPRNLQRAMIGQILAMHEVRP